jgi:hypothetical protein
MSIELQPSFFRDRGGGLEPIPFLDPYLSGESMNTAVRLMSILALSLLLGACAQPTRETPTEIEPTDRGGPTTDPVEVDRVDPANFADSRTSTIRTAC